jgi:hypothetical protein
MLVKSLAVLSQGQNLSTGVATVQCLPLFTLLSYVKANAKEDVNVMEVDYFSLDVEGNELDVLMTIPFDSVLIKVSY